MPGFPLFQKHQKIIPFILFSFLILGMGAGLRLLQSRQTLSPKAQQSAEAPKYGSTALEEVTKYPKPPNHVRIAENLYFASSENMLSFKDYMRSELDFLWINTGAIYGGLNPTGLDSFNSFWSDVNQLKAPGSAIKVGIYNGGVVSPDSHYVSYSNLADQDILHMPNGTPVIGDPGRTLKVVNAASPATRAKNAQFWKDVFLNKNIDGVMYDSFAPGYYAAWIKDSLGVTSGCLEGPCHTLPFWQTYMGQYTKELTDMVRPYDKSVLLNGLGYYDYNAANPDHLYMGPMQQNIADYGSGVLSEHIHRIYGNETQFKAYMEGISNVTARNKEVFFWAEPHLLLITDPGLQFTNDLNLERFYLASYLLIQKNPLTTFGYHPGIEYRAFDEEGKPEKFFYPDWNLDFGKPLYNYAVDQNGTYYRAYEHGVAVVNPSNQSHQYTLAPQQAYLVWDPCAISQFKRDSITVPAKTGMFLFYHTLGCAKAAILSAPTSIVATELQTTFSWTNLQGATGNERVNPYEVGAPNSQPLGSVILNCAGTPAPAGTCTIPNLFVNPGKKYEYRMFADDGVAVIATSNQVSVTSTVEQKIGDIGGNADGSPDGKVNIQDYILLFESYGKKPGETGYNARADLNGDTLINILDYTLLFDHFGQ